LTAHSSLDDKYKNRAEGEDFAPYGSLNVLISLPLNWRKANVPALAV